MYTHRPPGAGRYVYTVCAVRDEEALGSNLDIRVGMRRREVSFLLGCVERAKPLRRVLPSLSG